MKLTKITINIVSLTHSFCSHFAVGSRAHERSLFPPHYPSAASKIQSPFIQMQTNYIQSLPPIYIIISPIHRSLFSKSILMTVRSEHIIEKNLPCLNLRDFKVSIMSIITVINFQVLPFTSLSTLIVSFSGPWIFLRILYSKTLSHPRIEQSPLKAVFYSVRSYKFHSTIYKLQ